MTQTAYKCACGNRIHVPEQREDGTIPLGVLANELHKFQLLVMPGLLRLSGRCRRCSRVVLLPLDALTIKVEEGGCK